jgi:hypothetical protein
MGGHWTGAAGYNVKWIIKRLFRLLVPFPRFAFSEASCRFVQQLRLREADSQLRFQHTYVKREHPTIFYSVLQFGKDRVGETCRQLNKTGNTALAQSDQGNAHCTPRQVSAFRCAIVLCRGHAASNWFWPNNLCATWLQLRAGLGDTWFR